MSHLKIEVERLEDKHGSGYYIGRLDAPIQIKVKNGTAFLLFISDPGHEELQIASLDKDTKHYSNFYTKGNSKLKIKLKKCLDENQQVFYVAKLRFDGVIDCSKGCSFLAFTSQEGREELQIEADVRFYNEVKSREPEIISLRNGTDVLTQ